MCAGASLRRREDPPLVRGQGQYVEDVRLPGMLHMAVARSPYPHARVETLIPPFFLGPFYVLPAVLFLGWWFLLQFFNGALSLAAADSGFGGIAWWAHVGGFAFGLAVCLFARRPGNGYHAHEEF